MISTRPRTAHPHHTHPQPRTLSALALPEARPPLAHALVPLPSGQFASPQAFAISQCLLTWQLAWLDAQGITFTLLASGDAAERAEVPAGTPSIHDWSDVITERRLLLPNTERMPLILLPAPLVTDCPLGDIARAHVREGRRCTIVRPRGGARAPSIVLVSAEEVEAHWHEWLPVFAEPTAGKPPRLPLAPDVPPIPARIAALCAGEPAEIRGVERTWRFCPPFGTEALTPSASQGIYIHPTARVAATAHLRGPLIIGPDATIGEHTHIGPWVSVGAAATIGERVSVETAALGPGARLEDDSCVYAGEIGAGATVRSQIPVLKARLHAGQAAPARLVTAAPPRQTRRGYAATKRAIDLLVGTLALLIVIPLFLVVIPLSILSSGWPVFFAQRRVGLRGEHFTVLKLRTMGPNAHHLAWHPHINLNATPSFKLRNDPRVTRLGRIFRKTSIDELPQLLNVLRGNMSLVGPRPVVPDELGRYGIYAEDLVSVKPGMTGLWQVSGRSDTTYARRIMLDVQYSETCSIRQDLLILLRTVPAVVFLRGAE
ncbi:MAG: sugar transferase [Ktedonobacterales bacterium]|nr:sugar transferase [Ktedonobacterales bacterium]